jgi:3-hydroxyisobutyrate dehydrogenase-like beta-hydroxyacid dehydrogenase
MAEKIGLVGTGIMGIPMSRRLLAAGFPLVVYDVRPEAMQPLLDEGAEAAESSTDVARRCGKVITILPNSSIVEEVALGPSGLLEGFAPGSIYIDMSSSIPTSTTRIAAAMAERGVEMIDAPVSGGPEGAEAASLTIMVGGSEDAYQACLPILRAMGKNIFHIGPVGSGHTMKTINNMMFSINMLGVAEALVLGAKAGLSPEKIVEVAGTGSGSSFALTVKAVRQVLANNYKPGFTTDLLYKDVGIATALGRELGVPLLSANLAHQMLGFARGRGMNNLDNSCVVKLIEEAAGIRVKPE